MFESDLTKHGHLLKPQLLVQGSACLIWEGSSTNGYMHALRTQLGKKSLIQGRSNTTTLLSAFQVDSSFRSETIRASGLPPRCAGVTNDLSLHLCNQPWKRYSLHLSDA